MPLVTETGGWLGLAGPNPTSGLNEQPWEGWQKVLGQHTRSPPLACRHARGHTHHMHNLNAAIGVSHIMRISN